MDRTGQVINLWQDINDQKWDQLAKHFRKDAIIRWHNTNEEFNVSEFVLANCEYPGDWSVQIERVLQSDDNSRVISIAKVNLKSGNISFHVTSIFTFKNNKIMWLDEFWSEDGCAPQWRIDRKIGRKIIND